MKPASDESILTSGNRQSTWPVLQQAVESIRLVEPSCSWWQRLVERGRRIHGSATALPAGVYIFIYHSIVDPQARQEWEQHYRKGELTVNQLATQLDILLDLMTPVALSEVPALWQQGGPERPCFVITFDDGLQNNLRLAHPIMRERGLAPTVFVNGAFAQGMVFYRILVAILVGTGLAGRLAEALRVGLPHVPWSDDPGVLFNQTKNHYQAEVMEQIVEQLYWQQRGDPAELQVHLNVDEVRQLQQEGWEIGNHTLAHRILSGLSADEVRLAIERNAGFWQEHHIDLIPFLAYPVGRACDVHQGVRDCVLAMPGLHGLFANGGVNLINSQTEWLRLSLAQADTLESVRTRLLNEVARTREALHSISNGS